jgi:hypothetical protein
MVFLFALMGTGFALYYYIDSNNGDGPVTWKNAEEPADGPTVAKIIADAKRLFPSQIKAANLPAAKSFFYKFSATGRINAESWQPIDHFDARLIALTNKINAAGDYYLYNCEIHYTRPIGKSTWTASASDSSITLGNGTPKKDSIHLIGANNVDKTLEQSKREQEREAEEYNARMSGGDKKKRPPQESAPAAAPAPAPEQAAPAPAAPIETPSVPVEIPRFGF